MLVAISSYMRRGVRHKTVLILVLGDIGRSPRMMYHAESFAKEGWDTYLVGYAGKFPEFMIISDL
jgi:beta-1,4-mannosyltransferase